MEQSEAHRGYAEGVITARVYGDFEGRPFTYKGKLFYGYLDPDLPEEASYWWAEGNMACDCNRQKLILGLLGDEILGCGESIRIDRIESDELPTIYFGETTPGHPMFREPIAGRRETDPRKAEELREVLRSKA